jgi:hypothetical protein
MPEHDVKLTKCYYNECKKKAYWIVGFSEPCGEYKSALCGEDVKHYHKFCDEHLLEVGVCANAVIFKLIKDERWKDIKKHDCELEKFIKKRCKE